MVGVTGSIPVAPTRHPVDLGCFGTVAGTEWTEFGLAATPTKIGNGQMKVRNSLKSLRTRHRNNRIVRRKGRVYIINKTQKRFKARQG